MLSSTRRWVIRTAKIVIMITTVGAIVAGAGTAIAGMAVCFCLIRSEVTSLTRYGLTTITIRFGVMVPTRFFGVPSIPTASLRMRTTDTDRLFPEISIAPIEAAAV